MSKINMMRCYLLVLLFLFDGVHSQVARTHHKGGKSVAKRADADFTPAQRQFQKDMLAAHNSYRALHCVPPLTLDDTISRSAQNYAEYLAKINSMVHSNSDDYGENLYMTRSTKVVSNVNGAAATDAWYNEINSYDFQVPGFSTGTGHFTQAVWKETTAMGVGYALTADGKAAYVVAQYSPPGNYIEDFPTNVLKKGQDC